jgi:hypothetical protein
MTKQFYTSILKKIIKKIKTFDNWRCQKEIVFVDI